MVSHQPYRLIEVVNKATYLDATRTTHDVGDFVHIITESEFGIDDRLWLHLLCIDAVAAHVIELALFQQTGGLSLNQNTDSGDSHKMRS